MNQLIKSIKKQQNVTTTTNGAKAFKSTKNACVDLFAAWGGMRGKDIIPLYNAAMHENQEIANRIILWGRDVREGAGERELFRSALLYLSQHNYKECIKILHKVPELGRWDDLFVLYNGPCWNEAQELIVAALEHGNGLCAKWMPRKGPIAVSLTKYMNLTPRNYRKTIVALSNTVEQKMCANKWKDINYSHVPSQASRIYSRAFGRHDTQGYTAYLNALIKGEKGVKVNAGAIYPNDILCSLRENCILAEQQWKALPNFVEPGMNFLPIIDTSSSMGRWGIKGSPANIAISLGLYLAERNTSVFKDHFITFSETPELQYVQGSLAVRCASMSKAKWQMNTNLTAVFHLILSTATANKVSEADMPKTLLIISDMQFDGNWDKTNYKTMKDMYRQHGYELPVVVFWNVDYNGNMPVKADKENTILVSGYSPSIMKGLLKGQMTPEGQMLETIMNERYNYAG